MSVMENLWIANEQYVCTPIDAKRWFARTMYFTLDLAPFVFSANKIQNFFGTRRRGPFRSNKSVLLSTRSCWFSDHTNRFRRLTVCWQWSSLTLSNVWMKLDRLFFDNWQPLPFDADPVIWPEYISHLMIIMHELLDCLYNCYRSIFPLSQYGRGDFGTGVQPFGKYIGILAYKL